MSPSATGYAITASMSGKKRMKRITSSTKRPKANRFRHPNSRARVLCKYNDHIVYDDGTFRINGDSLLGEWQIVPFLHTKHNIFFYKWSAEDCWQTDYNSDDEGEISLGETVDRALANNEVKKMLSGQHDEATKPDKI